MKLTRKQLKQIIKEQLNQSIPDPKRDNILYHGSRTLFYGPVEPRQARDISGDPEQNLNAIYATENFETAVTIGMVKKGSDIFGVPWEDPYKVVIVDGEVRHGEETYIYVLPKDKFRNTGVPDMNPEWVSTEPVQPLEILRFPVDDYLHLIRYADEKDMKFWCKNDPDYVKCK